MRVAPFCRPVLKSEQLAALDAKLNLNKQEVAATVIDNDHFKDECEIKPEETEEEQ